MLGRAKICRGRQAERPEHRIARAHHSDRPKLVHKTPTADLIGEGPLKGRLVSVQVLELQQSDLSQGSDGVMRRLRRHHQLRK